jgi:hypothetical protein
MIQACAKQSQTYEELNVLPSPGIEHYTHFIQNLHLQA